MKIPSFKYYFPKNVIDWISESIRELLESGDFLTQGKYVEQLEREFAKYVGVKHAIAVSNGTAALEIIMRILDVKGFEVVMPTNTFAATAYGVIYSGGRPVFSDIEKNLNFNPEDVKRRVSEKTKAIIPVHVGGLVSPRIIELMEFAEEHGLYVVEDAAHAHGSMLDERKAGAFGIANAFSFFSTKVMTTGEGGMITTSNDDIAEKARLIRDQGKVKGNLIGVMGYNWRMTEFQAIVGLAQLRMLEEMIAGRRRVARLYDELVADISILEPLVVPENVRHNYYKYILFLPKGRDPIELKQYMNSKYNISLAGFVYEVPLHRQPVFKEYVDDPNSYPVADDLCYRHIALPIYPQMTDEEAQYVVDSLKSSLRELGWMG